MQSIQLTGTVSRWEERWLGGWILRGIPHHVSDASLQEERRTIRCSSGADMSRSCCPSSTLPLARAQDGSRFATLRIQTPVRVPLARERAFACSPRPDALACVPWRYCHPRVLVLRGNGWSRAPGRGANRNLGVKRIKSEKRLFAVIVGRIYRRAMCFDPNPNIVPRWQPLLMGQEGRRAGQASTVHGLNCYYCL